MVCRSTCSNAFESICAEPLLVLQCVGVRFSRCGFHELNGHSSLMFIM